VIVLHLLGEFTSKVALALLVGGALVAVIGFMDDHADVLPRWRFAVQVVAATVLISALGGMPPVVIGSTVIDLGWSGDVLSGVFLIWLVNLYNFMDGIDGIAGIEALTVSLGATILLWLDGDTGLAVLAAVVGAAALGFLIWNWPPAKIFMGDVGSGFLGFIFGGLALLSHAQSTVSIFVWSILLGVFIIDALVTLVRRIATGHKFYEAHRTHAYQHAAISFQSHAKVCVIVGGLNLAWLFPIAFLAAQGYLDGSVAVIVAYGPLIWMAIRFKSGVAPPTSSEGVIR
jgi:Fuc2NAc and GlcNAc transferase